MGNGFQKGVLFCNPKVRRAWSTAGQGVWASLPAPSPTCTNHCPPVLPPFWDALLSLLLAPLPRTQCTCPARKRRSPGGGSVGHSPTQPAGSHGCRRSRAAQAKRPEEESSPAPRPPLPARARGTAHPHPPPGRHRLRGPRCLLHRAASCPARPGSRAASCPARPGSRGHRPASRLSRTRFHSRSQARAVESRSCSLMDRLSCVWRGFRGPVIAEPSSSRPAGSSPPRPRGPQLRPRATRNGNGATAAGVPGPGAGAAWSAVPRWPGRVASPAPGGHPCAPSGPPRLPTVPPRGPRASAPRPPRAPTVQRPAPALASAAARPPAPARTGQPGPGGPTSWGRFHPLFAFAQGSRAAPCSCCASVSEATTATTETKVLKAGERPEGHHTVPKPGHWTPATPLGGCLFSVVCF